MKKLLLILGLLIATPVFATVLFVPQGGTGASTLTGCLTGHGTGAITGSGSPCGAGGGTGGTFATTTSQVAGQFINYPLNNTDIVTVGNSATTSAPIYFDPNLSLVKLFNQFFGSSSSTLQAFTFTNATGTNATTTSLFSTTASSSNLFTANLQGAGLKTCNGSTSGLSWAAGLFGCTTITPAASSITGGAALTKTDDTNVTLTLGGSPSTALLGATSLTLGWAGTLADARVADNLTISGGTVDNSIIGGTSQAAGSFTNILATASSTLQNYTGLNSTTTNATTTTIFSTTSSSTNIYGGALATCNSVTNALTWNNGKFGCNSITSSSASSTLLIDNNNFTGGNNFGNATTTNSTSTTAFATTASTTNLYLALGGCSGSSALNLVAGKVTCGTVTTGTAASSTLLGDNNHFSGNDVIDFYTSTRSTTTQATTTNFSTASASSTNLWNDALITTANLMALGSSTLQNFTALNSTTTNATSTTIFSTTSSSTNIFGGALATCTGSNALQWSNGKFSCAAVSGGSASSTLLTDSNHFTVKDNTIDFFNFTRATGTDATTTSLSTTVASTTRLVVSNVKSALFITDGSGNVSGYGGASACSANNFVTGISALGGTTCGTAAISGVNLGGSLFAHTHDSTLSGTSYNGSAAVSDWGLNLTNGNVWAVASTTFSGGLTFTTGTTTSATSTNFFTTTASTTNFFGGGLFTCNAAGKALTWSAGLFNCTSISAGAASSTLLTDSNHFTLKDNTIDFLNASRSTTTNATTTTSSATTASSTNLYVDTKAYIATTTDLSGFSGSGLNIATSTVVSNAQVATRIASTTAGTSLTAFNPNWQNGNVVRLLLSGNATIVINSTSSNPIDGGFYALKACQDSTGSRTLTFITPQALRWPTLGATPGATTTISSAANSCSYIAWQYDASEGVYMALGSTTGISSK